VLCKLQVQQLETAEIYSNFLCTAAISLNANQFITPVYKMKYLLKWQYSKHQLGKFIDIHGMVKSLYINTSLPAFLVPSQLRNFEWTSPKWKIWNLYHHSIVFNLCYTSFF